MGERQPFQPFRFRLPWLNMPAAPRPTTTTAETEAPRPVAETQAPTRPTASVPLQRLPFRPPGIAPVQPPPSTLSPPRKEPQPPTTPPRAATESRTASQPASPSRVATEQATPQPASPLPTAAQSRAASLPRSPSRAAPQSRPASVPSSPSHIASQSQSPLKKTLQPQSPQSSQPSSPYGTAARGKPAPEIISLPPPPPKTLEPTTEVTSQPPQTSTQPTSFATQQEENKSALPQPVSRETQSIHEIRPETSADAQNQLPIQSTTQPDGITTQHSEASGLVAAAATRIVLKPLSDSTEKPEGTKGGPNFEQEQIKEKELNWPPKHKTDTEIPNVASNSDKEQLNVADKEQKELGKQESLGKKDTSYTTSNTNGRGFKTENITHPKERSHKPSFLNGERVPLHKEIREDISKFVHKLGRGGLNQTINDKPINVTTLAGENRGASMQLGTGSGNKERPVHIRRGYKINPDESVDATTDAEGSSGGRRLKDSMAKEDQATKAYVNSNAQSINNSIVLNTSVSERNPGVQLHLSQNPPQLIGSNGKLKSLETHKAEFNITPAENLTYQPTVRRRCLRGLFMESSDSDPDNPDKPRRHGCRYGCWEKGKDKDIGIL